MKGRVLVLGAGLVARPLVRYLLERDFGVTVASRTVAKAAVLLDGHAAGRAVSWTVDRVSELAGMVGDHDLAVSLLPAPSHPVVARACLAAGKHMVTTSYVSPEMAAFDAEAEAKGLLLLNEIGVDPGIDHMSIMKVIDHVRGKGGRLTLLRSCCGGLPAPEANDNPLGYKFSWSPAGVLVAMTGPALFLEEGRRVDLPPGGLFGVARPTTFAGLGDLEFYPNRDSLGYVEAYGLEGIETMFRGTFRWPGWCALWEPLWKLGLLDRSPRADLESKTFARAMAELAGVEAGPGLRAALAGRMGLPAGSEVLDKVEWLGLLSDRPMGKAGTLLDCLAELLLEKLSYREGERDMLVMRHDFVAAYPDGSKQTITSTMLDFGVPGGDSSMARTVSLPAAIAARLVLEGRVASRGVRRPLVPEIYEPVLEELAGLGITLREEYRPA